MKKKRAAPPAWPNLRRWTCWTFISVLNIVLVAGVILAAPPSTSSSRDSRRNRTARVSRHDSFGAVPRQIINETAQGGPCQYAIIYGTERIVPGTTDTDNHCTWCDTTINLPFPFVLYDQTFNAVMVNSSGRLDFVCNNEPSGYTETCLPAPLS